VYAPIGVVASLGPTCTSQFTYSATVTGGSNPSGASYSWTFSGGGTTTPSTSTAASGVVTVGTGNVSYTGMVTVTDPRTDIVCTASNSASATPFAALSVALNVNTAGGTCPATDAASFVATASGGNGSYTYTWSGGPGCSGTTCTIDPSDSTFCDTESLSVLLGDTSGVCPPVPSKPGNYSKVTTVTASVGP
jgi:hypothetical protein